MTDWGAHHNDIAQWGLGMDDSGPIAVEAEGEAPSKEPNSYNCHPNFKVTYTYANGAKLICTRRRRERHQVHRRGRQVDLRQPRQDQRQRQEAARGAAAGRRGRAVCLEQPHGQLPGRHRAPASRRICPAEVGHRSVTVCHIGNIALRTGKKLKWDPVKKQFDDAEANKMLSREMRKPWKLEV